MKNNRHWLKLLRKSDGQVAIFVALMFQVLFVFFAMIVNVGLLVHHKINLQNSVDLAAYYGAMKQAESLNAIAHVNYQIRQSYKLLTFRYEQLGSAGTVASTDPIHPNPFSNTPPPGQILRDDDKPLGFDPAFCVAYNPWNQVNADETYCRDVNQLDVPTPGVPTFGDGGIGAIFAVFQNPIRALNEDLRAKSQKFCKYAMASNWIQLAKYIAAYKYDVRNRKKLIYALANEMSQENPRDIQGDSIKEGVYKTLVRNLSYPNQEGLKARFGEKGDGTGDKETDFKFINSFSMGDCRGNPSGNTAPGWLKEIYIFPVYAIFDGECGDTNLIKFKATYFNVDAKPAIPKNLLDAFPDMVPIATQLQEIASEFPSSNPDNLMYRSTVGFEKNPWCVGYVGVSAKTTPKIPFSPLGSVTMTATAYAKPFGGRIGPWYGTVWPSGATESDKGKMTDALLPVRVEPQVQITAFDPGKLKEEHRIFPNHSRYMGDEIGIMSELTVAHFAKAISQKFNDTKIQSKWWDGILEQDFDAKNVMGDSLAWDKDTNKPPLIRNLEIAAIAPDQFDSANYSIDPDFYNNYLRKIEKGYGDKWQFMLRGDLGSRMMGSPEEKRFSIRNQIDVLKDPNTNMVDWQNKLTYYLNQFAQVLTAWQQKSPDEYVLDKDRFGKCADSDSNPNSEFVVKQDYEKSYTLGSCKKGGRTGYSVKLVDGKFLSNVVNGVSQDYELGGRGQSGRILNPPPADF